MFADSDLQCTISTPLKQVDSTFFVKFKTWTFIFFSRIFQKFFPLYILLYSLIFFISLEILQPFTGAVSRIQLLHFCMEVITLLYFSYYTFVWKLLQFCILVITLLYVPFSKLQHFCMEVITLLYVPKLKLLQFRIFEVITLLYALV